MVSVIGLDSDKVAEVNITFAPPYGIPCGLYIELNPSSLDPLKMCKAVTEEVGADKPVKIANFLCPGNYAVSGSKEGCDVVEKRGKEFKARMTVSLLLTFFSLSWSNLAGFWRLPNGFRNHHSNKDTVAAFNP